MAVPGLAGRHPDPALADAVFLDIGLFGTLKRMPTSRASASAS